MEQTEMHFNSKIIHYAYVLCRFNCVWLFETLWTIAHQAPVHGIVVFALAPSLHSFWIYFSTDLQ